ncbi:MAG TPA: DUF4331 domain-containing protein [Mycobacteriales bacterium]|nr:DUF4331 domain-containing protein [Mycobacteriales bacterium]
MTLTRPVGTRRAGVAAVAASGVSLAAAGALLAPGAGTASSHREAPLVAADPAVDNTDVYAFVSPDAPDTVTLIANWIPFQEPNGGPNFYPFATDARYDVNIDNNGDAKPDVTYRWTFKTDDKRGLDTFLYNNGPVNSIDDETLLVRQTYTLQQLDGKGKVTKTLAENAKVAPSRVGAASMPNYEALRAEAITEVDGGGKSFAGQADDPFFLDLRVFDLLYGGNLSEVGKNTLTGYNVNAMAVQVPKTDLAGGGDAAANPIIGVWTTAQRPSTRVLAADGTSKTSGEFVQVSRLGNPLVNEVVVPLQFKDAFNGSKPEGDQQFLPKVQDPEVPKLIEKIYKMPAPATPRDDLVSVFLTGVEGLNKPANVTPSEQLRLNMSIAPTAKENRMGVVGGDKAGFPNGRRLADDVIDISLQVLEGELKGTPNDLGDGVDKNDVKSTEAFPYVGLPHSGSKDGGTQVLGTSTARSGAPAGGVAAGGGGTADGGGSLPLLPMTVGVVGIGLAGAALLSQRRTAALQPARVRD